MRRVHFTTTHRTVLALALAAPLAAQADLLITNLDQPVRNVAPLRSDFWYAQSFLTPAGSELSLQMVTALTGNLFGTPGIVAELRADAAGQPGTLLAPLSTGGIGTGALADTALAPLGAVTLLPSSTYWLLIGVTGSGGFDWAYAQGNGASGSGSFFEYTYSLDQATSWIGFGTEDPMMMRIDVSPVPEPALWALFSAGLLAIGLARRRTQAT